MNRICGDRTSLTRPDLSCILPFGHAGVHENAEGGWWDFDPERQWTHRWRVKTRLPERQHWPCRVTARGRLNTVRVEFADGLWVTTSAWSVRRAA